MKRQRRANIIPAPIQNTTESKPLLTYVLSAPVSARIRPTVREKYKNSDRRNGRSILCVHTVEGLHNTRISL
jgi:hypothetical protein